MGKLAAVVVDRAFGMDIDFWIIHREDYSRIGGASLEGTAAEMREVAAALESKGEYSARRVAVRWTGSDFEIWSPRNHASNKYPRITPQEAEVLAEQILRVCHHG